MFQLGFRIAASCAVLSGCFLGFSSVSAGGEGWAVGCDEHCLDLLWESSWDLPHCVGYREITSKKKKKLSLLHTTTVVLTCPETQKRALAGDT